MVWSLLDICTIVQISFSTSLTCHLDMWWSGVTRLERSAPGSLGGPLAFLVFPVSLLCPVAGHLLLRSETQEFTVGSLSLVHLQWFAAADLDPPCAWWHCASLLRSNGSSQVIFSMDRPLLPYSSSNLLATLPSVFLGTKKNPETLGFFSRTHRISSMPECS